LPEVMFDDWPKAANGLPDSAGLGLNENADFGTSVPPFPFAEVVGFSIRAPASDELALENKLGFGCAGAPKTLPPAPKLDIGRAAGAENPPIPPNPLNGDFVAS